MSTYYISPLFEVTGSAETRYYYFNGQRVAMHNNSPSTNGVLTYLHTDHPSAGSGQAWAAPC